LEDIMNLLDIIAKNSRVYPDETAFVELRPVTKARKEVSWRRFEGRVNKIANALKATGVRQGDRVLLLGRNSIHWLEVYFGVLKTGAWMTPLNFRFTNEDITYCAKVSEPVACFCDEEYAERMSVLRRNLSTLKTCVSIGTKTLEGMENLERFIEPASPKPSEVGLKDEDPCGLYFTSGTTGAPKPILLTHKNLFASGLTEATNHFWTHTDSLLMIPPLYHSAIGHLLGPMIVGARSVLLTEAITPQVIFEAMSTEQLSVVFLLVPWTMDILGALDRGELQLNYPRLEGEGFSFKGRLNST
jgi:acyl-CoA synthetase (AMP-forming)/AMP-acid ligase II